ncbi:MAG: hypothetical protein K0Q60_2320 [Microvirga sp.]|jgi:hypothetical protein|nr:hypothetical protein [Microvirga sp.]
MLAFASSEGPAGHHAPSPSRPLTAGERSGRGPEAPPELFREARKSCPREIGGTAAHNPAVRSAPASTRCGRSKLMVRRLACRGPTGR